MKNSPESMPVNNNESLTGKMYETNIEIAKNKIEAKEYSKNDIENRTESAKKEALETALAVEKKSKASEKIISGTRSQKKPGPIGRKQMNESYKKTISQVQQELNPAARIFSKITHNPVIERVSEFTGNTVAKPNAMLSGAIMAFALTLITYTIAKKSGYQLSGFETIGAFAIGWLLGNVYDFLKLIVTGKK